MTRSFYLFDSVEIVLPILSLVCSMGEPPTLFLGHNGLLKVVAGLSPACVLLLPFGSLRLGEILSGPLRFKPADRRCVAIYAADVIAIGANVARLVVIVRVS